MKRWQQTRRALGSEVVLTLIVDERHDVELLFTELWQEISLFEATFSRFQPDSELTHVNKQAGMRTEVSPEFADLIDVARQLAEKTGGLYNPFVLPKLQAAGYKGSWPAPEVTDAQTDFSEREVVGIDALELGEGWVKIPASSALDFGGIGKGYLLDMLAGQLQKQNVQNYWLSLGGDIICAGKDIDDQPWKIGIQHADGKLIAAEVHNAAMRLAIATSGVTKRRGEGWHHLIDPRTGMPAKTDILTATVCATSATEADVLAKCAVILGTFQAEQFLREHKITNFVVQSSPKSGTIAIRKIGEHIS